MHPVVVAVLLLAVAAGGRVLAAEGRDLPALRVEGDRVLAGDRPIRLRGINWGWWRLAGTRYVEEDMRSLAGWGANLARLAVYYDHLESDDRPGVWLEDGFRQVDEVVQWGRRHGVYVVLDMHNAPGGQNPSHHTVGGKNRIWKEPAAQERFVALWREIARRYRDRPEVAAYELMNEPETRGQIPPAELRALCERAIAAIRSVDREKIIVVMGDHYSGPGSLTDDVKVADPNVLYTFHFYDPGRLTHQHPQPGIGYPDDLMTDTRWIGNLKDGPGISGTGDWVRLEERFTPPAGAAEFAPVLRSNSNRGAAWFDEVRLETADGKVLHADTFGAGPGVYRPERHPESAMQYDRAAGHLKPGSMKISGTPDYNGWYGPTLPVLPNTEYRLSAWVKLEGATGHTFLTAAYFAGTKRRVDLAYLRESLQAAAAFGKRHRVPVWVGEFGCSAAARPEGSQTRWVRDCIRLFEERGFHWSYWNHKETTRPGSMALFPLAAQGNEHALNLDLLAALREGWERSASGGNEAMGK